jgi:hypothetical protein
LLEVVFAGLLEGKIYRPYILSLISLKVDYW